MKTQFSTIVITICLLASAFNSSAQNVGINATGAAPDNSALLDLNSTDKGFLITRVDTASIAAPAFGLMTLAPSDSCLYMFSGANWIGLGGVGNDCPCNCGSPSSQLFTYTGASQSFTVPPGVTTITVDVLGAQGGGGFGGNGGNAKATITVTPGEVLEIYVGENPTVQIGSGWNGGGSVTVLPCGGANDGWPGGGASDVRRAPYTLAERLIVGGGGGGQGYTSGAGGVGGGNTGNDGAASWIPGTHGKGGTQTNGGIGGLYTGNNQSAPNGAFGIGGNSAPLDTYCTGSGGGGGWYGGGGGYVSAGGGGSSYVAFPGNTATSTTAGVNPGNGQVSISW